MADDIKTQIEHTKGRIRTMLKTVPPSVNNGSFDTAVAYKKIVKTATKYLDQASPDFAKLQQAAQQLATYY